MYMFNLKDRTIMIFGGTGELMGNIAIGLAKQNAKVIIIGRNKNKATSITNKDPLNQIDFIEHDILKDDLDHLFIKVYKKYSHINMLINGAGINSATPFLSIGDEEIKQIFEINYTFVVKCCQRYIKKTLEIKKSGNILNIGSVSGINPLSKVYMYSASKAALHNLSKNLAREYGNDNIQTNILVPGFFPAEQNKNILSTERISQIMSQTPMKRFGKPCELIGMVILLASDHGSFINGSELIIDGGYSINKI